MARDLADLVRAVAAPWAGERRRRCSGPACSPAVAGVAFLGAGVTLSPAARAHHVMDGATPGNWLEGLVSGLAHPIIGLSHFLFLLTLGIVLAYCPWPRRLLAVAALAVCMLAGVLAPAAGRAIPMAELFCSLSVIVVGAAALSKRNTGPSAMVLMVGLAALFHGAVFSRAIIGAEAHPLIAYLVGLSITAAALVVGIGVLVNALATGFDEQFPRRSRRWTGIFAVTVGNLLLLLSLGGN